MPKRKWLKILAAVLTLALLLAFVVTAYAVHASQRVHDVPFPQISADRSPEGVARGAVIFHATCEPCHRAATADRASGASMAEVPGWLGQFHSGNITSDPRAGIGAISDAVAARMIRYGVNRSGHWAPMPAYAMSDADLAAVLGFLRSDDPLFRPEPKPTPPNHLSTAGSLALFLGGVLTPPARPSVIRAPARAPTADYGRYLAEGIYQCGDCHTAGFDADKVRGPDAFAGGAELKDVAGNPIYSPNLTQDPETGIGRWSRDQFARAIRSGIRPDNTAIGYPMPRFRGADDIEVDALLAYLRSFPARANQVPGRHSAIGSSAASSSSMANSATQGDPARAFQQLGCVACHGPGAAYESKLQQASGKPALEVARWIRNPELFRPGTPMPTFASVLDESAALELATWIQLTHGATGIHSGLPAAHF